MSKRILLLAVLLILAALALARDKPEDWVEVSSQHFVVATNGGEKQGRRVADQFERMRAVFQAAFPKLQIESGAPIIVLAIKDDKDFRALEPAIYLTKGQMKLGGLFLHAPDKNYVLMRLDAEGDHPYAVIYHEYTHFLMSGAADWLPLWLNEGLAEFYQNTEIHDKDVSLGEPSAENLALLRQNRLLPLTTLLTVDQKSPYYHEENKGSIFYAEAWALTHYIQVKDRKENVNRLKDYSDLLIKGTDPVAAASTAFGDLKKLQFELELYVQQASFTYFKLPTATGVDESTFKAEALTAAQIDALRADFLAYNERTADARALVDRALQEDPNNALAHETMGFLEFRAGHLDEAKKSYAKAVQLDSQSYLAHYYFAAMSINEASSSDEAQIENSLRTAIKLNPSFAPPYDLLAVFLATHRRNLEEAHTLELTAVSLDPGNVHYRVNVANILLTMGQSKNATEVLRAALKLAKTAEESDAIGRLLMNAEEYQAARDTFATQSRDLQSDEEDDEADSSANVSAPGSVPHLAHRDDFTPKGPSHFLTGKLVNVHCNSLELDLTLDSTGKSLSLHSGNFYKIKFTTLGFAPTADLNPCKDLEGRPAKVEYVESADKSVTARPLSIELHK